MRIGVTFPQTEIGSDPVVLRDYAQAAEDLGYTHLLAYDHVVGGQPGDHRPGWDGPYNYRSNFHEPFVLFSYLGAITKTIDFITGILILPQRQTALVAKQAAGVDILTGGRLKLGVGIGWNEVEYEALNEDFHTRGKRCEEQIEVMRLLWTDEVVSYEGRFHHFNHLGIAPRPSRPIPVWMGGMSETVMKRAARISDGWFPLFRPGGPDPKETLDRFASYVREYGRSPDEVGVQAGATIAGSPDDWRARIEEMSSLGVGEMTVNTMGQQLTARQHIDAIRRYREAVGH
ncbi:MAG TPA: LLM class F420-dependent oxidoreductase [Dehalococcoidia bacterium]|nr:LLM class F420-dependent oxidoreductase [Dehalococcoidia bacterium]